MRDPSETADILDRTRTYLVETLLPFWLERSPDVDCGGFLTCFDRDGQPTGETVKTFLMQIRMLYTMAGAHRAGCGGGRCAELAERGASFLLNHYWDDAHGGWVWIADREGRTLDAAKIGYGQCFAIYAFSEYFLATGDPRGREAAERTRDVVMARMADGERGGYFEIMKPDWTPEEPGRRGGDRKSMDVHMHMMEALTTFYEMTARPGDRAKLTETIDLIRTRMLHPATGTAYIQFTLDFEPIPAILFEVEWGRDAQPADGQARPLDTTSYGHNVEFAWLLLRAADVMGIDRRDFAGVVKPIFDHCVRWGIDREYGGVFVEGPHEGPATVTEKQFWQQAEVLVGMLDAYTLFGDEAYWDAFRNVYDFVFANFVQMAGGGEWFERLDRRGRPIDDALGHAWKISYHTVRSMIQTIRRLGDLVHGADRV